MKNFLLNNATGASYGFDSVPQNALMAGPDYSEAPVEIPGIGRGYRVKGDSGHIITSDGRVISLSPQADAGKRRQSAKVERELLDLELKKVQLAQAQAGSVGPKLPAGQRMNNETGELEWIPGSPGHAKIVAANQKARSNLDTHLMGTDALLKNINDLIGDEEGTKKEHPGLRGSVGYVDSKVMPFNRDQSTAQAYIKSLLDKSAVSGLQAIRQSGTAPGSITEKEWPIFQNLIATLNPAQDEESFIAQLKELRRVTKESQARAKYGYEQQFGAPAQPAGPPVGQPPTPQPSPPGYVEVRVGRNGQRIGKKADGTFEVIQ